MEKKEMRDRLVQLCVKAYMFGSEQVIIDLPSLIGFVEAELDKAREEGYQKGLEDGSKGKVFEKIEVETEVTFKDLRDVIEGREDAGEFLSKLTTK